MAEHQATPVLLSMGTEFNDFLYERIGAGPWDAQVSVVSALARLDLDPWEEADRLSRLPAESATISVSAMLSRIPEIATGTAGRLQTARRLVQLLPKRLAANKRRAEAGQKSLPWLILAAMLCLFPLTLAAQIYWQGHHGAAPPANASPAPRAPAIPSSKVK